MFNKKLHKKIDGLESKIGKLLKEKCEREGHDWEYKLDLNRSVVREFYIRTCSHCEDEVFVRKAEYLKYEKEDEIKRKELEIKEDQEALKYLKDEVKKLKDAK